VKHSCRGCTAVQQGPYDMAFFCFFPPSFPDESDSILLRRIYLLYCQSLVNKTYCNFSRNSEQRIAIARAAHMSVVRSYFFSPTRLSSLINRTPSDYTAETTPPYVYPADYALAWEGIRNRISHTRACTQRATIGTDRYNTILFIYSTHTHTVYRL